MNKDGIERIAKVIAEISQSESLAKYKQLKPEDITKKSLEEYVTSVDLNIQKRLIKYLKSVDSESIFLSEEIAFDKNKFQQLLNKSFDKPLWVIDPLDGTQNFIKGIPNFTTAVALVVNGAVIAAWIHSPIKKETICAKKDDGAWIVESRKRLTISPSKNTDNPKKVDLNSAIENCFRDDFKITKLHSRSASYIELAKNVLHAAIFTKELQPWDHLPGTFIHREAGGYNAMLSGNPYSMTKNERILIMAPNKKTWKKLRDKLDTHIKNSPIRNPKGPHGPSR